MLNVDLDYYQKQDLPMIQRHSQMVLFYILIDRENFIFQFWLGRHDSRYQFSAFN